MDMYAEGTKIGEIRRFIDDKYTGVGESTDTPLPPEGL